MEKNDKRLGKIKCFSQGYWNWAYGDDDTDVGTWPVMTADTEADMMRPTPWGCKKSQGTYFSSNDDAWITADPTECFIGNELYSTEMVFCDQKCATAKQNTLVVEKDFYDDDGKAVHPYSHSCGGPWYCSKTKICVDEPYGNEDRKCTFVLGCANATQCEVDVDGVMIDITDHSKAEAASGFGDAPDSPGTFQLSKRTTHVAAQRAGGVTVKTYCCDNSADYDSSIDLPCNGASGIFRQSAVLIVAPLIVAAHFVLAR